MNALSKYPYTKITRQCSEMPIRTLYGLVLWYPTTAIKITNFHINSSFSILPASKQNHSNPEKINHKPNSLLLTLLLVQIPPTKAILHNYS